MSEIIRAFTRCGFLRAADKDGIGMERAVPAARQIEKIEACAGRSADVTLFQAPF